MQAAPKYKQVNPHLKYGWDPGGGILPIESTKWFDATRYFLASTRWVVLIILWGITVFWWLPRICPETHLFAGVEPLAVCIRIFASAFIFYSLYHLTALTLAIVRGQPRSSVPLKEEVDVPVGVIYTVCDDFQESASETLVDQEYKRFHVYICDDSQNPEIKERIDRFHSANRAKTTIIRRQVNVGFKAGNINHALQTGLITEPLVLVVDADEKLGTQFLISLVAEFVNSEASFLQASHRAVQPSITRFQRILCPSVAVYWRVYEQARNFDGFPLVLGHGVLLPRLLISKLGWFDENMTSEDIEFSYKIASNAKVGRGCVSSRTWAFEEVPLSLQRYRSRFCRWLRQDLVLGLLVLPKVLSRTPHLSFSERFDLFVKQFHIPVCGLVLPYLVMLAILFLLSGVSSDLAETRPTHAEKCILIAVGLIVSIAPSLPVLFLAQTKPLKRVSCAAASIWLFNSLIVASGLALAHVFVHFSDAKFVPTGCAESSREEGASARVLLPYLAIVLLAGLASCALLGSMSLAAIATVLSARKLRCIANCAAAILLVVGLLQLSASPMHVLALLVLGTFRY